MADEILTRKPLNLAITTNPEHDLNITSTPIPSLQPNECLIHIRATGICGSDVHFWKHGAIGSSTITSPNQILGHESSGVVVKTGPAVTRFKIGDRVALENGIPCSLPTCRGCRTGSYHGCPAIKFFSSPPVDGTMKRYHSHHEAWLHRLPDEMTFEEGALLEPLSVALAGVEKSALKLGDEVVICGAGPIGLVCLLAVNAAGVGRVVVTDVDEFRLQVASKLVPRVRTVLVEKGEEPKGLAERIKSVLGGEAGVVLECTGVESSIHAGIYANRFGGTVHIIGVSQKETMEFPFMPASFREIDIKFQFRYHETYPKAILLVQEGLLPGLKELVTHRFTLEEGREAFETASTPGARAIKVLVVDE